MTCPSCNGSGKIPSITLWSVECPDCGGTGSAFRLCYVERPWAWFTTCDPLENQWGDDWDDTPYEHNAGEPYEYQDHMKTRYKPYKLLKIAWEGSFDVPSDHHFNSPWSVMDINDGNTPWLANEEQEWLFAGVTLPEFKKFVTENGGHVYTSEA